MDGGSIPPSSTQGCFINFAHTPPKISSVIHQSDRGYRYPMAASRTLSFTALFIAGITLLAACSGASQGATAAHGPSTPPSAGSTSTTTATGATSTSASAATSATEVVVTATATDPATEVEAPADSTSDLVLTATAKGVTFTITIPPGALPNDLRFTVASGTTSTGEPAMLVEPSGLALLKPARLTVTGAAAPLLAWGPTGTARRLPAADAAGGSPIVILGGIGLAHSDAQANAVDGAHPDPITQWARDEEADESIHPDGLIHKDWGVKVMQLLSTRKPCTRGDRKSAAEALAAHRAGVALGAPLTAPPSCFDVSAKITITYVGDIDLPAGVATFDEAMSGKGLLSPDATGHQGDLTLAAERDAFLFRKDKCRVSNSVEPVFHVASSWPGKGMAQLEISVMKGATSNLDCGKDFRVSDFSYLSTDMMQALAALTNGKLVVSAPITEGSFYIFSLLNSVERVHEWKLAGHVWESAVSGARARFTFTVDIVYSVPD
jgi:hypothetical protein